MKNSILLVSAGRRTSLLRAFLEAASDLEWRVLAGDRDALAPALYLAHEAIQLPVVRSSDYIPQLLSIVQEHGVRLIVPTIDTELLPLAQHASEFKQLECAVLISSPGFIEITRDKWLTMESFRLEGVSVPKSWLPAAIEGVVLPEKLFIKPRDGSASQNAFATTPDSLHRVMASVPHAIIQEQLTGPEITIDALLSLKGEPIHFVPRQRIKTVGGESIQGVTLNDADLRPWIVNILEIASKHGARGPLTLQAFLTERGPVLTEINARFGGGFPLTRAAGGDYPRWLLEELSGRRRKACFGEYTKDLYMTRYYIEHFTERPLWR